jgi:hypothetical protein
LISGYPREIPTYVSQEGMVASESFSFVNVRVKDAPEGFMTSEAVDMILVNAAINPGNSGGPVYEAATGGDIGICEAYEDAPLVTNKQRPVPVAPGEFLTQNSALAVIVPIKYAIDLLVKNSVSTFSSASINPTRVKNH